MKTDQLIILVFLILGILSGFLSNYSGILLIGGLVPLAIFGAANFAVARLSKSKRSKQIAINSAATFFPIWIIVWVFLFNLR